MGALLATGVVALGVAVATVAQDVEALRGQVVQAEAQTTALQNQVVTSGAAYRLEREHLSRSPLSADVTGYVVPLSPAGPR